jgi:hypothetical protein
MGSRWFNVVVVFFWLSTMSWLVTKKVLPSLLVGDPPSYETIIAAQRSVPEIAWQLFWDGHEIGWATCLTKSLPGALTEIHGTVHVEKPPLREMLEGIRRFNIVPTLDQLTAPSFDARNNLWFDPLGRLSQFEFILSLGSARESMGRIVGRIDGPTMIVETYIAGGLIGPAQEFPTPRDTLIGDALSPQGQLPGLREGQTWTSKAFNPLSFGDHSEILHATVEPKQSIPWNGQTVRAWVVVYRGDPGSRLANSSATLGRLWVLDDGTVVKQEAVIFNSTLTFRRLTGEEAAKVIAAQARRWPSMEPAR